jgi:hypothetical protein
VANVNITISWMWQHTVPKNWHPSFEVTCYMCSQFIKIILFYPENGSCRFLRYFILEMSTTNLRGDKERPMRKADNLTTICKPIILERVGASTPHKLYGPPRPVTGTPLTFFTYKTTRRQIQKYHYHNLYCYNIYTFLM